MPVSHLRYKMHHHAPQNIIIRVQRKGNSNNSEQQNNAKTHSPSPSPYPPVCKDSCLFASMSVWRTRSCRRCHRHHFVYKAQCPSLCICAVHLGFFLSTRLSLLANFLVGCIYTNIVLFCVCVFSRGKSSAFFDSVTLSSYTGTRYKTHKKKNRVTMGLAMRNEHNKIL